MITQRGLSKTTPRTMKKQLVSPKVNARGRQMGPAYAAALQLYVPLSQPRSGERELGGMPACSEAKADVLICR